MKNASSRLHDSPIQKAFHSLDQYGYEVGLNFNQSGSTVKTVQGGIASLFTFGFFIFYFYTNVVKLLEHDDNYETFY